MNELSVSIIRKALEGLTLRSEFTAQNIANANSPDYRATRVDFEDQLRLAAANGQRSVEALKIDATPLAEGNPQEPMRLDLELATAAQTAMRFRALIDVLGRRMALERSIAAAGR